MKINKKFFFLCVYYGFARFLPPTNKNIIGRWGGVIRSICVKHIIKKCGWPINIEHMAYFGNGSNIELGNNSCLGIHCHYPNNVIIGDHVMFGPHCYIMDSMTHKHDRTDIPIGKQGMDIVGRRTIIGNDCWFGRQVLMMAGKHVGDHVIIAAGSVLCRDIPDYALAGGNPIDIIKDRRESQVSNSIN